MKTVRIGATVLTLTALVLLLGCATVYEEKFPFSAGWRRAEVVSITPGSVIERPEFWSCVRNMPTAQRQDRSFALLSYQGFSRKRHSVVPLPPNMSLQAGDSVYLNLGTCEAAIATRATGNASRHEAAPYTATKHIRQSEAYDSRRRNAEQTGSVKIHQSAVAGETWSIEREIYSATPVQSASPRTTSQANRAKGAAQSTGSIEELIRWLS